MIAACGLDCDACDIRRAPDDRELAEQLTDWFRQNIDPYAQHSWFHCSGCLGDREDHWSPDCWILLCAVDGKGLDSCSECGDFPCSDLKESSRRSAKYGQAFELLQELRRTAAAR